jgi:hypothetical protein
VTRTQAISIRLLTVRQRPCYKQRSLFRAMSSVSNANPNRKRRLIRSIALLFLLHAAIDLTSPQLCMGETLEADCQGLIAVAARQRTDKSGTPVASIATSDKQGTDDPSEQPCGDEDCFCCCSHVIPGTVIAAMAVTNIGSPVTRLEYLSAPSPPLARAFHPPRFA